MELFAKNGVNGTSLQMIADQLGVGKASVYYQFKSKAEIVHAVVQPVFDDISRIVKIAEAVPSPNARREVAVSGLVELSVRHRSLTSLFFSDSAMDEIMRSQQDFTETRLRFEALLLGPSPDVNTRVTMALVTSGIYGAAMATQLEDVSDTDLHSALSKVVQDFLASNVL